MFIDLNKVYANDLKIDETINYDKEFYNNVKLKKQFDYADKKGIKFLAIVGENEVNKGVVTLKNLQTGEQEEVTPDALAEKIK